MFIQRAIVTLTLGPLLIYLVVIGGWLYFVPVIIVLSVAAFEYCQIFKAMGWSVPFLLLFPFIFLLWLNAFLPSWEYESLIVMVGFFATLLYALWLYERRAHPSAMHSWLALLFGIMAMGWLSSHFFLIRSLDQVAYQWTILTFMIVWFSDSGAYLVGRFLVGGGYLNRHPMTPKLSPNKTMEGLIGGTLCATAVSIGLAAYFQIPMLLGAILALVLSFVGPMGDLSISMLKRTAGVKDSGRFFPGHGGALDRIDSMLWAVPTSYYLAIVLFERFL